jgi:hypothetical protein
MALLGGTVANALDMDWNCAGTGLHWLRETLHHRVGDQLQLTLRLWHLGPLEPLGGWRTRDTMSTVRHLALQILVLPGKILLTLPLKKTLCNTTLWDAIPSVKST